MLRKYFFVVMVFASFVGLAVTNAQAQVARTFVSGTGTDNSTCSITAPCRSLSAALAAVQSGGEIYCLTSGGYGSVTINKSVVIACDRVDAALSGFNGATAITIAAGTSDGVTLQGLHISGGGTGGIGINYVSGGAVLVDECFIDGFGQGSGAAISVGGPKITVKDSKIVANQVGISINAASTPVGMSVTGSLLGANAVAALSIAGGSNGAAVSFDKDQVTGNGAAVVATGASQVSFDESLVSGNTVFFNLSGGSGAYSYGNNQFSNNGGVAGPNTSGYTSFGSQ